MDSASAATWLLLLAQCLVTLPVSAADWFDDLKVNGTDAELHQLLYEMPKGGDLHLHLTGSGFPEWWYELALASKKHGYSYYTRIRINNCQVFQEGQQEGQHEGQHEKQDEPGTQPEGNSTLIYKPSPFLLLFETVAAYRLGGMNDCERGEYVALEDLSEVQRRVWLNAISLDVPSEGRDEFFHAHWQRLGDLTGNPWLLGELLVRNIKAFSAEGLVYMEPQLNVFGLSQADGSVIEPDDAAAMLVARLARQDVVDTGMTFRFQQAILRFLPDAEQRMQEAYEFVARHELWVAVNMVGREDDDKGYPLRFLDTLRQLRQRRSGVRLSIHAGEVDEPNYHVRDTLLLGADRIGHGLNLITDPDTMRLMRHGPYMVEINLISNLLLEYINDYSEHPFPEYLRTGIPVALSTDDRGIWDSTMTDEFFVAVREFNLSWAEVRQLSENSLRYAFVPASVRERLLNTWRKRMARFETRVKTKGWARLQGPPSPRRQFICRKYQLCPR